MLRQQSFIMNYRTKKIINIALGWIASIAGFMLISYSLVGTKYKVDEIKSMAPASIQERGWKILRYEGWQYGSWYNNGGKVWYHVADTAHPTIQYRIYITLWDDELHYCYGNPETLNRVEIQYK